MLSETRAIVKEIPMPFIKTISIESYLPKILKNYATWTMYICQECGKAEVFIHKKKMHMRTKKK
jgi:hypothetical protein